MATLDFTHAAFGVDTTEPGFITYAATVAPGTPTSWSFITDAGNRVRVTGTGMTFDAAGRPTGGAATAIEIDVDNNGSVDLAITGINAPAATLDAGPASFWRFLDGNDVVLGRSRRRGRRGTGRVSVIESGGSSLFRANTDGDADFESELLIEDGGVLGSAYRAGDLIL